MNGLFITGTDTGVGKTYIACQIAAELSARKINVIPRKPVESGCAIVDGSLFPDDAACLLKASQADISLEEVCPYRFEPAISPQLAAQQSGQSLSIQQLKDVCLNNVKENDFLLVEGAGGFYSPICDKSLNADLAIELDFPMILVVEDRLGSVNQALLAIEAIENRNLDIQAIILNSTRPAVESVLLNNLAEIKNFTNHSIFSTDYKMLASAEFFDQLLASKT